MKLTEEELELFELAFLLRLPLYKLMEEMSYLEMLGWFAYFKVRPHGWKEDYRTSLLLTAAGVSAKGADIFPSLKAIDKGNSKNAIESIKDSAFGAMIAKATGGDQIGF
jgi:hypothetical protein